MDNCYFCQSIERRAGLDFIDEMETDLFVATWDINPVTPGHVLVIPKRHAQYMRELNTNEQASLIKTVLATKEYILRTDLVTIYSDLAKKMAGTKSEAFLNMAKERAMHTHRSPDAFNDGLNDGPASGQTVPHFHWHVMPRWDGDMADPRGGIRHMFSGMGNYHDGIQKQ